MRLLLCSIGQVAWNKTDDDDDDDDDDTLTQTHDLILAVRSLAVWRWPAA